MARKFGFNPDTLEALDNLRAMLTDELNEHRENFDERNEKWQESDPGLSAGGWLDELEELVDLLDRLEPKAP